MGELSIFCCYILVLLLGLISPLHAGQWRDTFEQEDLPDWTLLSEKAEKIWESEWKVSNGNLNVNIKLVRDLEISDFLQWTARQLDTQSLIVKVHSMDTFRVNDMPQGELGVFLGKDLPRGKDDFATGYFFSKIYVDAIQFDKNGKYIKGDKKASFFHRLQLEIQFQAGHFWLFSEDVLLTEFVDPELLRINVVGLLALTNGVADEFRGRLDTFIISAPQIPNNNFAVQSKGKLVTTWSKLKGF